MGAESDAGGAMGMGAIGLAAAGIGGMGEGGRAAFFGGAMGFDVGLGIDARMADGPAACIAFNIIMPLGPIVPARVCVELLSNCSPSSYIPHPAGGDAGTTTLSGWPALFRSALRRSTTSIEVN